VGLSIYPSMVVMVMVVDNISLHSMVVRSGGGDVRCGWVSCTLKKAVAQTQRKLGEAYPTPRCAQVRRYLVVRRPVAAVIGLCLTVGECRLSVL
jgi:hypothetical protein